MTADNSVATEASSDHDTTANGSAGTAPDREEGAARPHERPEPRDRSEPHDRPERRERPIRPIRPGRVAVTAIVVALLVACGYLGLLVWADHREGDLRRSATEDATRLVVQLATYDHADVDANLEAVVAEATPGFAERYREVSEGLRELLTSGQGTSAGTVVHAGVQSVDSERAVVLVFLDQEVTNVTVPEGRVDASRMVVTLLRDGDRWLLDAAELA